MIILGTDEAGYGPNLGPLVVSLTAWKTLSDDLSELFEPLKNAGIPIGDSKKIYHGRSLAPLEIGVLVPLRLLQRNEKPVVIDGNNLVEPINKLMEILQQHQVQLLDMQYRSIEPDEFNRNLDHFGSKGSLLSNVTLRLIVDQITKLKEHGNYSPILVLCDKHGGRNHYLDLLTEFFPEEFIQSVKESRESSIYRWTSQQQSIEFRFIAKGESHLPIALASMLSKYQRELAMIRFNEFWQSHVAGLQPTAGYPEDAKRFKKEIADAQKKLDITEDSLWRKR